MYWLVAMAFGNGCVIRLYKPTTTLQPKVLGFVWCDLSHRLFPKAMDNQPELGPHASSIHFVKAS